MSIITSRRNLVAGTVGLLAGSAFDWDDCCRG
jgi:hypothetical protein